MNQTKAKTRLPTPKCIDRPCSLYPQMIPR
jgi:hypothetical protein